MEGQSQRCSKVLWEQQARPTAIRSSVPAQKQWMVFKWAFIFSILDCFLF